MEELWNALRESYESLSLLQHIHVQNPTDLIALVVGLAGGIVCAIAVAIALRLRLGTVVDALLARGAVDPATALTPAEGGFDQKWFLSALRRGKMLRKTVAAVSPGAEDAPADGAAGEDALLAKTRFYLPPAKQDEARRRFSRARIEPLTCVIAVAAILVTAVLLLLFLPSLLRICDNLITSIRG